MRNNQLLFIASVLPQLTGNGMAMRVGALLESACRESNVTLLVVVKAVTSSVNWDEEYWRSICNDVIVLERLPKTASLSNKDLAVWLANPEPRLYEKIETEKLYSELSFLRRRHFHVALISRLANYPLLRLLEKDMHVSFDKKVLDLDDIESISHARRLKINGVLPYGKLRYFVELFETAKLRRAEKKIYRDMDAVLICSENDRHILNSRYSDNKAYVVPNVTRNLESCPEIQYKNTVKLLFVGTLSYGPNEDAVRWMIEEVLPCLKKKLPKYEIVLRVVGREPPAWMRERSEKFEFELHPDVPDVTPFYSSSHIVVVPIRHGAGTRIKILEAFGLGRPVVSTKIGAEGIEIADGHDIHIANDPEEFSVSIVKIWNDAEHRAALVANAQRTVLQKYSLECCIKALEVAFEASASVNLIDSEIRRGVLRSNV